MCEIPLGPRCGWVPRIDAVVPMLMINVASSGFDCEIQCRSCWVCPICLYGLGHTIHTSKLNFPDRNAHVDTAYLHTRRLPGGYAKQDYGDETCFK